MKKALHHSIRFTVFLLLLILTGGYATANYSEAEGEKAVVVYMDGHTGDLVVNNASVTTSYEIQLFDLTGKEVIKVVQEPETPISRIQTSQLRKGVYLVRVTPAPNAPSVTLKVMIR